MFRKLRKKLTFFCTFATGLILVGLSLVCLFLAERSSLTSRYSQFQSTAGTILNHLETQTVIAHSWLAEICASNQIDIDIQDNQTPLLYEDLNPHSLSADIFDTAVQIARDSYGILEESITSRSKLTSHAEFHLTAGGTAYFASVGLIPKDGGVLKVTILYSTDNLKPVLYFLRISFFAADLVGILLLGIFSWFFTGRMLRPLEENRKKQMQFVASASHELRSPLTVMLSCLSAMEIASRQEAAQFARSIKSEGERMGRLIDDMLTLSNADNANFPVHPKDTELDTLLLSVYEKFEPLAHTRKISLSVSLPGEDLPLCRCDGERISQVLSILLDNALSYTPQGGKVALSLSYTGSRFQLAVRDTGMGIPDEEKNAIFERFYRCDKAHKDKEHFGLGLCIAKEIVRIHKGTIKVFDADGGGACFVLELP